MEFHIAKSIRDRLDLTEILFSYSGNVVFANLSTARKLALDLQTLAPGQNINAGALYAMGLIDELSHALIQRYRENIDPGVITDALGFFSAKTDLDPLLLTFATDFPVASVYQGFESPADWLAATTDGTPNREIAFEELLLVHLANRNPAYEPFKILFSDAALPQAPYTAITQTLPTYFNSRPELPQLGTLLEALLAPILADPTSITAQLDFIREHWAPILGEEFTAATLRRTQLALATIQEEEVALWLRHHPGDPNRRQFAGHSPSHHGFRGDEYIGFDDTSDDAHYETAPDGTRRRRYDVNYQAPLNEYEAFSADHSWMPNVVLIAKSTYVWLEQLSKHYKRHIHRLDQIPTEELQILADRGITGLWLIGLWERSRASQTIKRLCGNADAVSSAYSLKSYTIAEDLGGEQAYQDLRDRAGRCGLRLASDMVPNHMGIDSDWVVEQPDLFISRPQSPFPVYTFEGPNLSTDPRVEIKLEDHYYNQSDAAVVFRLRTHSNNQTRFVYHGNDGTTFAWNDTAQLDYSKAEVRKHVMQVILDVARRFPIIRFDAAMVLAKRHVQRLWFPLPGAGGSIPSRAENAISEEQFEQLMPKEFWREVVDRVAHEVPGTLLLAEAFWLLEGYFVRTLGMHRVYNSAFMNMMRDEENAKYRSYLKKTLDFDPDILKRYVNFMSNPDEKTAREQFGEGDKYFGTSVLLVTLPGLPMFGHGQVEGFNERYGMDFKQARQDEVPNQHLIDRHNQLIAPLLANRQLFAESANFTMYDYETDHGVDENVFAYSNRSGTGSEEARGLILYNNAYNSTHGTLRISVPYVDKGANTLRQRTLAEGLAFPSDPGLVLAFRDTVQNLEFLRRASDLREHGLTIPLRGYQHAVLLHWRPLQSTAAHPWDTLSDSLDGGGVPSVDEAMRNLSLRPVYEALRHILTPALLAEAVKIPPPPTQPATKRQEQNMPDYSTNNEAKSVDAPSEPQTEAEEQRAISDPEYPAAAHLVVDHRHHHPEEGHIVDGVIVVPEDLPAPDPETPENHETISDVLAGIAHEASEAVHNLLHHNPKGKK